MEPKNVIESILDVYNLNATEFAEKIDVQRSSVSHIMTGRNNPSLDFLIKVKNAFPKIRWEFLIHGKLPMYLTDGEISDESGKNEFSGHENEENVAPTLFDMQDTEDIVHQNKSEENSKPLKKIDKIVIFYSDGTFNAYKESSFE